MIYRLNNQLDRQQFREKSEWLLKRQVVVELKEKKHQRSLSQNSYLHVCLSLFAVEFGYDLETVKYDYFKRTVNKDIFERKRDNKHGQEITYLRSTSDLDTGEMTTAIERWRNWCVQEAGLYIPEPNEQDAIMEAERMISMAEKYL